MKMNQVEVIRDILKDPRYQEAFKFMLYMEIKKLPRESQIEVIKDFRRVLNGYH